MTDHADLRAVLEEVRHKYDDPVDVLNIRAVTWSEGRNLWIALAAALARLEAAERELIDVLDVAIARGESLGYLDEDYLERRGALAREEDTDA